MNHNTGTGHWQISVIEKHLDGFGQWDNIIVGGDTGHSYVVLKNPQGEVVSAIQGAAFTPITGRFDDGAQSATGIASTLSHQFGLSKIFNKAASYFGRDLNVPLLRGTIQDGPDPFLHKESGSTQFEHPLLQGSEEEMRRAFASATDAALDINAANLEYHGIGMSWKGLTYGVNCHSFTVAMMDAMGIERGMHPHFIFKSPGKDTNLHESVPALAHRHPSNYDHVGLAALRTHHGDQVAAIEDSLVSDTLRAQVAERLERLGQQAPTQTAQSAAAFTQG